VVNALLFFVGVLIGAGIVILYIVVTLAKLPEIMEHDIA
jgi:hypothetical protein